MATIDERLETARERLQQKQPRTAVKLLRGILREAPNHIESLALLANVALAEKKFDMARDLLTRAIKFRPGNGVLRMNLGLAYFGLGQLDEAIAEYDAALQYKKQEGLIHFHRGNALAAKGRLNDAAHSFQRTIHLRPKFTPAHYRLADVLADAGAVNAAVGAYQKVLELEPRRDDAYVDLGNVLRRCDNDEQAMNCFRTALEINPRSVSALNNLANTLRAHGQPEAAAEHARRAVAIAPRNPVPHNSLGLALAKCGLEDEALASYQRALELRPNYANAHYNRAGLYQEFGNFDEAEAGYLKAIECDPKKPEAQYRLACLRLLRGELSAAWPLFDARWKMEEARGTERTFDQPAWDGGSLEGKTILLYAEQGFGDTLQFVRYAKLVKQRGATVILEAPRRLVPFLLTVEGIDRLIAKDEADRPAFDVQAALLSLPALLQTTLESIPADVPYLSANPDKISQWKSRIEAIPGLRVGIAWQGKKSYLRDATRSIPLMNFSRLAEIPGVHLLSLQKGHGSDQLQRLGDSGRIHDLGAELDKGSVAFEDTAAVMKHLDLVITSDTSIAHLAGGLGVPVWVALSYSPEWRWLLNRADSPWYPTMRLFRQPARHDWQATFEAVDVALRDLAAERGVN